MIDLVQLINKKEDFKMLKTKIKTRNEDLTLSSLSTGDYFRFESINQDTVYQMIYEQSSSAKKILNVELSLIVKTDTYNESVIKLKLVEVENDVMYFEEVK